MSVRENASRGREYICRSGKMSCKEDFVYDYIVSDRLFVPFAVFMAHLLTYLHFLSVASCIRSKK